MPYITQAERSKFDDALIELEAMHKCMRHGDVLFLLKGIIKGVFSNSNMRYQDHNNIIGAITASYLEVCRRFNLRFKIKEEYSKINTTKKSKLCVEVLQVFKKDKTIQSVGELNYFISRIIEIFIREFISQVSIMNKVSISRCLDNEISYLYSDILLWFYKEYSSKYEDLKILENTDAFDIALIETVTNL